MKYILILSMLFLAACARSGSENSDAFRGDSATLTDASVIGGTWYNLSGRSKHWAPEGIQWSFSSGHFTRAIVFQDTYYTGTVSTIVSVFTGTYLKNGENITVTYASPKCMAGKTEVFKVSGISENGLTLNGNLLPPDTKFQKGDFLLSIPSNAVYLDDCRFITQKTQSDRKPASVKKK